MSKNENIPIISTYAHLNRFNEMRKLERWEFVLSVIFCVQHFVSYDIIWCYHWLDPDQNFILLLFSTWNPKWWENNVFIIAIVTTKMWFSNAKAGSFLLYIGLIYNSIGYNFFSLRFIRNEPHACNRHCYCWIIWVEWKRERFDANNDNRMEFFVWFNDFSTNPSKIIINNSNSIQCKSQSKPHSMAFLLFQLHFWYLQVYSECDLTHWLDVFPFGKEIITYYC